MTARTIEATPWALAWEWIARPSHYRAVREFRLAAESGDRDRLGALLDPGVAVVVDPGGPAHEGARVVEGLQDAITLLVHGLRSRGGLSVVERSVNGQAGLLVTRQGEPSALINVDFTGRRVSVVWVRLHPDLVRRGNRV